MKRYIIVVAMAMTAMNLPAQDFDTEPTVTIENEKKEMKFTVGARFMADAALYHTEFTPLQSGATISDARIRTSMQYKDWYFYADFGFGGGKFQQKNIFLEYTKETTNDDRHIFKGGYYNDPAGSMARNTSLGSYHFISRPGVTNALGDGRELGITYRFTNDRWMAYQGVFTENEYNTETAGYNGLVVSGRWIYRPVIDDHQTLHVGLSGRFSHIGGGEVYNNVLRKSLTLSQSLETYVDNDPSFVTATLPWANNVWSGGVEALYHNKNFFVRGEYLLKYVTKKRDSYSLFIDAQNNIDGWGSLELWENANKLKNNTFMGGYVEAGYKIFGHPYTYDKKESLLGGLDGRSLEIVGRLSYTGLNNRTKGEYFNAGRGQYYSAGHMEDWPGTGATTVGGGNILSATVGINYAFNKFAQVMLDYTYHHLDRDLLPYDKNFHQVQARLQFAF